MTPHYIHIHRKILPAPPFESASILRDLGVNADCQDKSWWWVAGLMVKWHAGQVCWGIWHISEKGTLKQAGNYTLWPNHVSIQKILPDRGNPCNAFQTMTLAVTRHRWWKMGSPFSPLSLVRSSRLKKLKSSLCTSVTSRVSQGPKQSSLTKMSIRSRLRLSKWSQESFARLLVAMIDFP